MTKSYCQSCDTYSKVREVYFSSRLNRQMYELRCVNKWCKECIQDPTYKAKRGDRTEYFKYFSVKY